MAYNMLSYIIVFLPLTALIYQLCPCKFRYIPLIIANCTFFISISRQLIIYLIAASLITYLIGLKMAHIRNHTDGKAKVKKKAMKKLLLLGIFLNLLLLAVLKYTNFFLENVYSVLGVFNENITFSPIKFLIPIGISFYTLEIISYLTDVYRGTINAEHNFAKVFLYLSFFPQIMEGPIARFSETADSLYSGNPISFENLRAGYQRILWGLFKKMVIADRFYKIATYVFAEYASLDGSIVFFGAIAYTLQLYMEFSGVMDIIIGSGEIFGVKLPENFRQPFFAINASDFWRRWHITLGTFFKDYIFYPVSLSRPVNSLTKKVRKLFGKNAAKFTAPAIALFCVWICNGLWHGANWTFIFYGMYYFVIIFIENIIEEPVKKITDKLHINTKHIFYRSFQHVKLFIIVIFGELFFRADSMTAGFAMFTRIFTNFHIKELWVNRLNLKIDVYDLTIAFIGIIIVLIVSIIRERKGSLRPLIDRTPVVISWTIWYACIFSIIFLGCYGTGYTMVDLIYAGY